MRPGIIEGNVRRGNQVRLDSMQRSHALQTVTMASPPSAIDNSETGTIRVILGCKSGNVRHERRNGESEQRHGR